jgi:cell division protein FtsX
MRNLRRFEAACGLVAALVGFLGIAYALFGPTYSFQNSSGQTGTANLLQVGIPPGAIVALCILSLGLIGEAAGAVLHSRTRDINPPKSSLETRALEWLCVSVDGSF